MSLTGVVRRNPILATAVSVVMLDQITKYLVVARVPLHARLPLVDGVLALTHVHNRGMAFGLFNSVDASWLRWLLALVAVVAVAVIWSYARHEAERLAVLIGFGAVLGGALGNLIDRVRHGYVVDFVLAHWEHHEFPAFNVADAAITMGGILLFLAMAREQPEPRSEEDPARTEEPDVEARDVRHDHI